MEGFDLDLLSSISHTFQSYRVSVLTPVASSLEKFISTPIHCESCITLWHVTYQRASSANAFVNYSIRSA